MTGSRSKLYISFYSIVINAILSIIVIAPIAFADDPPQQPEPTTCRKVWIGDCNPETKPIGNWSDPGGPGGEPPPNTYFDNPELNTLYTPNQLNSLAFFDEGAMEFDSIQVPPSGSLKDNCEVNLSNGHLIFTLPTGIKITGRCGHNLEIKLLFNSGIDRPNGRLGRYWNMTPYGFLFSTHIVKLGEAGIGNPSVEVDIERMIKGTPYLKYYMNGYLSVLTNVDALKNEYFYNGHMHSGTFIVPSPTFNGGVGYSVNFDESEYEEVYPGDFSNWLCRQDTLDKLCTGITDPFHIVNDNWANVNPDFTEFIYPPGQYNKLIWGCWGTKIRDKEGTIYCFSPYYKRQDERFDLNPDNLPHNGANGENLDPDTTYEFVRVEWRARLEHIIYRNGDKISYFYDEVDRLESIRDCLGRRIYFKYGIVDNPNLISKIYDCRYTGDETDNIGVVTFEYYPDGILKKVKTAGTGVGADGNVFDSKDWQLEYDITVHENPKPYKTTHLQKYAIDNFQVFSPYEVNQQSATPYFESDFTYVLPWTDQEDHFERRVVAVRCQGDKNGYDAGGTSGYVYDYDGEPSYAFTTTVTNPKGNDTIYVYDKFSNLREEKIQDSQQPGTEYVTYYDYWFPHNLVKKVTYPNENYVSYYYQYNKYEDENTKPLEMDVYQVSNVLKISHSHDGIPGTEDPISIHEEYTYEPLYNQISTEISPRGLEDGADPNDYKWEYIYSYQEGSEDWLSSIWGWGIDTDTFEGTFYNGDVNGSDYDGTYDQANLIRINEPPVNIGIAAELGPQEACKKYWYNDAGQILREIDEEGRVISYEYYDCIDPDGDGENVPIEDQVTTGGGYLQKKIQDPDDGIGENELNYEWVYTYDNVGNLISEKNPNNNYKVYFYNERHQIYREVNGNVDIEGNHYDEDYEEILRLFDYDDEVVEVRIRSNNEDHNGTHISTNYYYDSLGNVRRIQRELDIPVIGSSVSYEYRSYDANNNLTAYVAPNGTVVTAEYDSRDMIIEKRRHYNSVSIPWNNQLPADTNQDGLLTFSYDNNGNLTDLTEYSLETGEHYYYELKYDLLDRRYQLNKPGGSLTKHLLDAEGNVLRITERGESSPGIANKVLKKKRFYYDERSRLYRETKYYYYIDEQGNKVNVSDGAHAGFTWTRYGLNRAGDTVIIEDDRGRRQNIEYDSVGRESKRYLPAVENFDPDTERNYTEYLYDGVGNITDKIQHEYGYSSQSVIEHKSYSEKYYYDPLNRQIQKIKDPNGFNQTWTYQYDSLGNIIWERNPKEIGIKRRYDTFGRMTHQIFGYSPGSESEGDIVGEYNADGLIKKVLGYDNRGNLIYEIDDGNNETSYEYDNLNRRVKITYADGTEEVLEYRRDDLIKKATSYDEGSNELFNITTEYDPNYKRKNQETITISQGQEFSGNYQINYTYDGLDRILQLYTLAYNPFDQISTLFTSIERKYDSLDNVYEEQQRAGILNGANDSNIVNCKYNGLGSRINVLADQYNVYYEFDELERIKRIDGDGSLCIEQTSRKYQGPGGRITSVVYKNNTSTEIFTDGYDGLGRITSLVHVKSGGSPQVLCDYGYGYNIANCRLFETKGHYQDTQNPENDLDSGYDYDSANRLIKYQVGHYDHSTQEILHSDAEKEQEYGLDGTGNFIKHKIDQVIHTNTVNYINAYTGAFDSTLNVDYDKRGNTTTYGSTDIKYDVFGRIVGMDISGSQAIYLYDGYGRRLMKKVDGTTTFYIMEGDRVIREKTGSSSKSYVWGAGIDELVGVKIGSTSYHAHLDALGSVGALTNSLGNIIERYDYDPYGVCEVTGSDVGNPYRFTGRRLDLESELYYYRARHYSPVLGRFLSRDPIGVWGDAGNYGNAYGYTGNNPICFCDPLGLDFWGDLKRDGAIIWDNLSFDLIAGAAKETAREAVDDPVGFAKRGYEATSYIDPTPYSDLVLAAINTGQGNYDEALSNCGGAIIPGAGDKAVKLAGKAAERGGELLLKATTKLGDDVGKTAAKIAKKSDSAAKEVGDNALKSGTKPGFAPKGETGKVYRVDGDKTPSSKPYVGRTKQSSPEARGSRDGRDRSGAEVVDTYDASNTAAGRRAEQGAMNREGGVDNLDNKRNEIRQDKWEKNGVSPPSGTGT